MAKFAVPWVDADFERKVRFRLRSQRLKDAYKNLCIACFENDGSLPNDDAMLAREIGMDIRTWRKHRATFQQFFTVANVYLTNPRVTEDLQRIDGIRAKRILAGQKGGLRTATRWRELK